MARSFNGTNQSLQAANVDLSGVNKITLVFWLRWDTFSNDNSIAFEFPDADWTSGNGGFLIIPNGSGGTVFLGCSGDVGLSDADFIRPSGGAWHHWAVLFDKSASVNELDSVYIDGVLQVFAHRFDNANNTNNFASGTLNFMARNNASLWGAGRLSDVAIYPGVLLNADEIGSLAKGVSPALVRPTAKPYYWPLLGRTNPELELFYQATAVVNGAAFTDHPAIIYPASPQIGQAPEAGSSPSPSPSTSASASPSTSPSASSSASPSTSASRSPSTSPSASLSATSSASGSASPSTSQSHSPSTSPSTSESASASASESGSATPSSSPSTSPSGSSSASPSQSASASTSTSPSHSPSSSPSKSASASRSASPSVSPSKSPSASPSSSPSLSTSHSPSLSASHSPSVSASRSASASPSPSDGEEEVPCNLDLLEIRTRVAKQLDDPDMVYWMPDELDHGINVMQRLWCLLTLEVERSVNFTLNNGQAFYSIADQVNDFIAPLRVSFNGLRLKTATIHQLDLRNTFWRKTPGNPTAYAQHGFSLLAIDRQPASGTNVLALTYAAEPSVMVNDVDLPEIAEEHQIWLEKGATWYALLKNGGVELKNGMMFLNAFLDAAGKVASFTRARSRGQAYDNVPFDLASFDRSRWELKLKNQPQPGKKPNA